MALSIEQIGPSHCGEFPIEFLAKSTISASGMVMLLHPTIKEGKE